MSDIEYIVRQARLYDVPAIARLEDDSSATPWSAESLKNDVMKNDKAYVAVATLPCEEGDVPEVIGYADIWSVAGESQLNNIAVDKNYRGRHIGEMLLSHMIDKSRSLGCDTMTLEVRISNTAAISLYTKMGFVRDAIRRGYYRDNKEDAVLMSRNIAAVEVDYRNENNTDPQTESGSETEIELEII